MRDFSDIANGVLNSLAYLGNRYLEAIYSRRREISQTLALFSDEKSRDLYCKEIQFCVLRNILENDLPSSVSGLMDDRGWSEAVAAAKASGRAPEFDMPAGVGQWARDIALTDTFYLEQYRYKDKVDVDPGDICLDIGACVGETGIWMKEKGVSDVWPFEIDAGNLECMRKNYAKKPSWAGIHLVPKAIGASRGSIYFIPTPGSPRGGGPSWTRSRGRRLPSGNIGLNSPSAFIIPGRIAGRLSWH